MIVAVRYFTKTGNTKKLADVIAQELGIEAKDVSSPLEEKIDILFLCNSVYWAGVDGKVKQFINDKDVTLLQFNFKHSVCDNSSQLGAVLFLLI